MPMYRYRDKRGHIGCIKICDPVEVLDMMNIGDVPVSQFLYAYRGER